MDFVEILFYLSIVVAVLGLVAVWSGKATFYVCIAMAVLYVAAAIWLSSWPAIGMAGYFVFCAFLNAARSD